MAVGCCGDECGKLPCVICKEAAKKRRMDKKEVATDESDIIIMAALMQNKEEGQEKPSFVTVRVLSAGGLGCLDPMAVAASGSQCPRLGRPVLGSCLGPWRGGGQRHASGVESNFRAAFRGPPVQ